MLCFPAPTPPPNSPKMETEEPETDDDMDQLEEITCAIETSQQIRSAWNDVSVADMEGLEEANSSLANFLLHQQRRQEILDQRIFNQERLHVNSKLIGAYFRHHLN